VEQEARLHEAATRQEIFHGQYVTPKGRELVKELVKKSDVLVENFGLGILEKWGLNWPDLQMINPRMILIRVKGMGCSGPHAADLTYGPNVGNYHGDNLLVELSRRTTATAEPRTQHPTSWAASPARSGVVLALMERKKTGRGQWIDSAQQEIGASISARISRIQRQQARAQTRRQPQPHRRALRPYQCKGNDRWCVIAVYNDDEWERFAALLGKSGSKRDAKFRHASPARASQRSAGQMGDELDHAARSVRSDGVSSRHRDLRRGRAGRRGSIQARQAIRRDRLFGQYDRTGSR
jgi:benzylsuccinate CoA-transferase BbsF subunit/naphthyl-2-methylsuccinate CoA transferase subunit